MENIYAYETTFSETRWMFTVDNAYMPNVWSDISKFIDIKIEAMNCYQSQLKQPPHPRTLEIIEALAKLRAQRLIYICGKFYVS